MELSESRNELISVDHNLVRKFSGSGPRYTSYPTAVEFGPAVQNREWKELLARDCELQSGTGASSLYFHIPFCHELCYFCACNRVVTRKEEVVPPYLEAVKQELQTYRSLVPASKLPIEQIHWGGGSPNYLRPAQMEELHLAALDVFPNVTPDADISIELDPRTTSIEQIRMLAKLGFNRLSLGVQDFDPIVQEAVNRIQSFEQTWELCQAGRSEGFSGVNIDLIYGLPNQTVAGFRKTIEKILEIKPDRIALYGYAHVTWIRKTQKALERGVLPAPDDRIEIFLEGVKAFSAAGYEYIGLDHFALPQDALSAALKKGRLNRNFMGYTTHKGVRILGFGVSSISSLAGGFAQNKKEVAEYQKGIAGTGLAVERGLVRSEEDCLRWDIIERIMCEGVLDLARLEEQWKIDFFAHFTEPLEKLKPYMDEGLLQITKDSLRLTAVGRLFARNIAMAFDAYLDKHRAAAKPVFSQAV